VPLMGIFDNNSPALSYFCLLLPSFDNATCRYFLSIILYWMDACIFSVSEIQNARGIMDVLAEMLNALDPGNREVPWVP
jgi:hypothetical protein